MTSALPDTGESLIFNGLDGASGTYLLPRLTLSQVANLAQGTPLDPAQAQELQQRAYTVRHPDAGVEADARQLSQTGWGAIFAARQPDADPALLEALEPLLRLRQEQAGDRFRLFAGDKGYLPGESKRQFLERFGMGPGPVDPERIPYYLLIVGDPETIPFRFQYQLDVQYAVGRIYFDRLEDYAQYAQSVVRAETGVPHPESRAPHLVLFGPANPDDQATALSANYLVEPLANHLSATYEAEWRVRSLLGEQASKAHLGELLNGPQHPALLFTASHGIAFPNGDPRQLSHQGALLCQDWPGPQAWQQAVPQDFYFSASDLSDQANLTGMIAFLFACYGAGTPRLDELAHLIWPDQPQRRFIAPRDFLAGLPRRLLSLPRGGALAVVGHIDRAWSASFLWGGAGAQLTAFRDCFTRLLGGRADVSAGLKGSYPLGYAMEVFNNRYAEIASELNEELIQIRDFFKIPRHSELAYLWTASNDARNYIILGDPAVRLVSHRTL